MTTEIICAFPTMGKSHYHKEHPYTTLDSDSSDWSWVNNQDGEKIRNPEFPSNYIEHIKTEGEKGQYEYIFVSTHKEVVSALLDSGLKFKIIAPGDNMKSEIIRRMHVRKSPEALISVIDKNYDTFMADIDQVARMKSPLTNENMVEVIYTKLYISDVLKYIKPSSME